MYAASGEFMENNNNNNNNNSNSNNNNNNNSNSKNNNNTKNAKLYGKLFLSMLKISATTFGGGYVIVPLLKGKFVDEEKLIEENEMLDLMAIAQSCPGPIAVNASVMVGYRITGVKGALTALLATILPPLVIISLISLIYVAFRDNAVIKTLMAGMLCGVSAVIIDVVIQMVRKLDRKAIPYIILIAAFIMACILKLNVLLIIGISAAVGLLSKGLVKKK